MVQLKRPEYTPLDKNNAEKRWQKPKWFKRIVQFTSIESSDFNMPKYQKCKMCNANCHIISKTETGAIYKCSNHGTFTISRQ